MPIDCAFNGCYKLIEVRNTSTLNITAGSSDYGYVGYRAKRVYAEGKSYLSTDKDGYIIYDDGTDKILVSYTGKETDLTLPSSITQINGYAFFGCNTLTTVTIGNNVTSIGNYAFRDCSSLTSVTIGNNVTSIGYGAFSGCTALTSVTIGNNVTSIGGSAFYNCRSLTSVTIGNNVTSIGYGAFWYCTSLKTVYYKGTAADWGKISIGSQNSNITNTKRYYYSESKPTESGNYWHYVDGKPTVWPSDE